MRPEIFDRYFAALATFRERPQPHLLPEAIRNIGVQFDRYFSAASLRLDDDRQANPFAACVRCRHSPLVYLPLILFVLAYSMISSAQRLFCFEPAALSMLGSARATPPERPMISPRSAAPTTSAMSIWP